MKLLEGILIQTAYKAKEQSAQGNALTGRADYLPVTITQGIALSCYLLATTFFIPLLNLFDYTSS